MPNFQSHSHSQNKGKKVVVITRAANGIGKAIAMEFARAGYILMINTSYIFKPLSMLPIRLLLSQTLLS